MKKGYRCPTCGNFEASQLAVITAQGKSLSVLLASQSTINKPDAQMRCLQCDYVSDARDFRDRKEKT